MVKWTWGAFFELWAGIVCDLGVEDIVSFCIYFLGGFD